MALLQDLIKQIDDETLRQRIMAEVGKLSKQKKFGLVFEEHLPECTPLYDVEIRRDSKVALKAGQVSDIYIVRSIDSNKAICEHKTNHAEAEFALDDLVVVAEFGEPIYPYLKPIDTVCNAPDSNLWHTLIEADNYHALQLLEYLYAGKVDCIYIDPPYNTGARDWKYNNDYVDSTDQYRHSKWLSMMEKRLRLAKKLLNPKDSVLIVTIDEKEYLHLGCLLEELFPEAGMQMISTVINPAGAGRQNEFSRTDEYIFVLRFGKASVLPESRYMEDVPIIWDTLRRSDLASRRGTTKGGTSQFYPIYVNDDTHRIEKIGDPIPADMPIDKAPTLPGCTAVFPIRDNGIEMNWGLRPEQVRERLKNGYIRVGKYTPNKPQKYIISYVTGGNINDIENGIAIVRGYESDGSIIAYYPKGRDKMPTTNWNRPTHDAQRYGTDILKKLLQDKRFSFPKSLYAVHDVFSFFISNKKDALIVDFFAGSGTTLHAVNLLNAEDGGHRRCIMVTNNEVSDAEAKSLTYNGYSPGDKEWEQLGIAQYVTWPRTVCSIMGVDVKGDPLVGDYGTYHEEYIPDEQRGKYKKIKVPDNSRLTEVKMADGFKANAAFFKLGFLDKAAVRVGRQFREMLPALWMKAGCFGPCPTLAGKKIPEYMVLPENRMAILNDNSCFAKFAEEIGNVPEIETVYLVTDSDADYRSMAGGLDVKHTYQLYRDYLDNFRINSRR